MDKKVENVPFIWMEESKEQFYTPMKSKRKFKSKKKEFVGWGSKPLIEFLQSIGKDTSQNLSHYDVTAIINTYVNENSLFHPKRKKTVVCDEKLHSLLGRKSVSRFKIHDMLEPHFVGNQEEAESGDELFYSSDEEEDNVCATRKQHSLQKKKVVETPKSCFAAIVPENIKLVYLRRSLVENLIKKPEEFEDKVVGSIVRVKCDPNDYLQKNSHQLVRVAGIRKVSGTDGNTESLLQVCNSVKDIHICMLSDDKFSEEECKDFQQRMKDGLLKRLTVVELKQKAQRLHEDITKHWIARELDLLQNLIDRANEKGWRKELFEYLERRQLLQTESEQSRLLLEVPDIVAEEIELEAEPEEFSNNAKAGNDPLIRPIPEKISDSLMYSSAVEPVSTQISGGMDAAGQYLTGSPRYGSFKATEVIELTDDEDKQEDQIGENQSVGEHLGSLIWYYLDPQGQTQGPFSTASLKRWSDAEYFPPDFKVWKKGENQENSVLLSNMLHQSYTD